MDRFLMSNCAALLDLARKRLNADCTALVLSCGKEDCMSVMARGHGLPDTAEFVSMPAGRSLSGRVLAENVLLAASHVSPDLETHLCTLMRAEELVSFLGVPVRGPDAQPVAIAAAFMRMERIWSRNDRAEIQRLSHTLSALLRHLRSRPVCHPAARCKL